MAIIAMFALLFVMILTSCNKKATTSISNTLEVTFNVEEQENVDAYVIQVSQDGKSFTDKAVIFTDPDIKRLNWTYKGNVDVSMYKGAIYSRVKSVDRDGKFLYSQIMVNHIE